MNCISVNMQGIGNREKISWIRKQCDKYRVNFLAIQETKNSCLELSTVRAIWGNSRFEFQQADARGNSGGILVIWEPSMFIKEKVFVHENYVAVLGVWVGKNVKALMVSVYFPQELALKKQVWDSLLRLFTKVEGEIILMGDFNAVRDHSERLGTTFNALVARAFNQFIIDSDLLDIPLGGVSFTWSNKEGKRSKLDRFLVSENLFMAYPNLSALVLPKGLPDHNPILLFEQYVDYGPPPFRFFHSWFKIVDFDNLVISSWAETIDHETNAMIIFKRKLINLKNAIKQWNSKRRAVLVEKKYTPGGYRCALTEGGVG